MSVSLELIDLLNSISKAIILGALALAIVAFAIVRLNNEEDLNDPWKPKKY